MSVLDKIVIILSNTVILLDKIVIFAENWNSYKGI